MGQTLVENLAPGPWVPPELAVVPVVVVSETDNLMMMVTRMIRKQITTASRGVNLNGGQQHLTFLLRGTKTCGPFFGSVSEILCFRPVSPGPNTPQINKQTLQGKIHFPTLNEGLSEFKPRLLFLQSGLLSTQPSTGTSPGHSHEMFFQCVYVIWNWLN